MKVETIVSADLSSIGKTSGQPIIVRMCLFPELEVSHSVNRSMAIFDWFVWNLSYEVGRPGLWLFPSSRECSWQCIPDVLIHTLPVILAFYKTVSVSGTLVA